MLSELGGLEGVEQVDCESLDFGCVSFWDSKGVGVDLGVVV